MADDALLLPWLDDHANRSPLVPRAVYEGLATRVRRGDFEPTDEATA